MSFDVTSQYGDSNVFVGGACLSTFVRMRKYIDWGWNTDPAMLAAYGEFVGSRLGYDQVYYHLIPYTIFPCAGSSTQPLRRLSDLSPHSFVEGRLIDPSEVEHRVRNFQYSGRRDLHSFSSDFLSALVNANTVLHNQRRNFSTLDKLERSCLHTTLKGTLAPVDYTALARTPSTRPYGTALSAMGTYFMSFMVTGSVDTVSWEVAQDGRCSFELSGDVDPPYSDLRIYWDQLVGDICSAWATSSSSMYQGPYSGIPNYRAKVQLLSASQLDSAGGPVLSYINYNRIQRLVGGVWYDSLINYDAVSWRPFFILQLEHPLGTHLDGSNAVTATITGGLTYSVTCTSSQQRDYTNGRWGSWYPTGDAGGGGSVTFSGRSLPHICSYDTEDKPSGRASGIALSQRDGVFRRQFGLVKSTEQTIAFEMHDIYPSAALSTGTAVQGFFDILSNNYLETITELAELGALLPDIATLLNCVKSLRTGNLLKAGSLFFDFLTDLKLIVSFGLAPDVRAASDLVDKLSPLLERLKRLVFDARTLYGKLSYTFPVGTFGVEYSTLVTCSKLRIAATDSLVMSFLLGSRATGLYPGLGNLWDLVPFSFIIDWFLRIGQRLSAIDNQVLCSALVFDYLVHSFTIQVFLDEDLLTEESCGRLDEVDSWPRVRYYERRLSAVIPTLRESKFDFLGGDVDLDFSVVGSLAWQLV